MMQNCRSMRLQKSSKVGPKHSELLCLALLDLGLLLFTIQTSTLNAILCVLGVCDSIDEKTKQIKKIKDEKAKLKVV